MWTSRTRVALGLFLLGTTCLWLAAAMAGRTPAPGGTACTPGERARIRRCDRLRSRGVGRGAWGVFKQYSWWETAAVVSGMAGLVAVVPFVAGQSQVRCWVGGLRRADQPANAHPGQRAVIAADSFAQEELLESSVVRQRMPE